jgi:hypothetical protein
LKLDKDTLKLLDKKIPTYGKTKVQILEAEKEQVRQIMTNFIKNN